MKAQNITIDINKLATRDLKLLRTLTKDAKIIKQINDRIAFIEGWMSEEAEQKYYNEFCA